MAEKVKSESKFLDYALLILLAVLVFGFSFLYFSTQLREFDVKGLKVLAKTDPTAEMKEILYRNNTIIQAVAFPGEDIRNSYVTLIAAEITGAFSLLNRSAHVYAYVPSESNASKRLVGCVNTTNYCSSETIIVQMDPCNCLKIEDGKIYVLYEQDRMKQDGLRVQLRGVFGGLIAAKVAEEKGK